MSSTISDTIAASIHHDGSRWRERSLETWSGDRQARDGFNLGLAMLIMQDLHKRHREPEELAQAWADIGSEALILLHQDRDDDEEKPDPK